MVMIYQICYTHLNPKMAATVMQSKPYPIFHVTHLQSFLNFSLPNEQPWFLLKMLNTRQDLVTSPFFKFSVRIFQERRCMSPYQFPVDFLSQCNQTMSRNRIMISFIYDVQFTYLFPLEGSLFFHYQSGFKTNTLRSEALNKQESVKNNMVQS